MHSVVSDSSRPYRLWPPSLLGPWDFPGKNTGVGSHFLFQGIFLTQGSNLCLWCLLRQAGKTVGRYFTAEPLGKSPYTHTHTHTHTRTIFFHILFPYRLMQCTEDSSLRYTVGPRWLPVLYIAVCICYSKHPMYPVFSLPFNNYKFVFYVCGSTAVLYASSWVSFFF